MKELYIDNLSGNEFEEYLVNLFKGLGYDVEHTPASNDYGADLVISKDDEKTVVQAKRYSSTVGISSVQEVIGAKNYYQAKNSLVVTNNYFTPNAIELATCSDVELWDRDILISKAVLSINPKFNKEQLKDNDIDNTIEIYEDELLQDAIQIVVKEGQASISIIQRGLKVGYARAAKIIGEMEERGIVGTYEGSKPRKVLISLEDLPSIYTNLNYQYNPEYNSTNVYGKTRKRKNKLFKLVLSFFMLPAIASFIKMSTYSPTVAFLALFLIIIIFFKPGSFIINKLFKNK